MKKMSSRPLSKKRVRITIIIRTILWSIICLLILELFFAQRSAAIFEMILALASGWLFHISRVAPQITYNPAMIISGLLALTIATYLFHKTLNWLHQQGSLKSPWLPRQTITFTSLITSNRETSFKSAAVVEANGLYKMIAASENLKDKTVIHLKDIQYLYEYKHPLNYESPISKSKEPWIHYTTTLNGANPELVLLHTSTPAFDNQWIVAFADGSIKTLNTSEFQRAIKKNTLLRKIPN